MGDAVVVGVPSSAKVRRRQVCAPDGRSMSSAGCCLSVRSRNLAESDARGTSWHALARSAAYR
eukprot:15005177-Alexandrium_andersonii.AAC.1